MGAGTFSEQFYWSLGVSCFFASELLLRVYCWWHTFHAWSDDAAGGFITDPFRFLDTTLVTFDLAILTLTLVSSGSGGSGDNAHQAKASAKLARIVRLARSARWLRASKILRSCRFVSKVRRRGAFFDTYYPLLEKSRLYFCALL